MRKPARLPLWLALAGAFAAGFLRDVAAAGFGRCAGRVVRRCFGGRASCIVASIFTSCFDSSRQTPAVSFGSEIGPMATRLSFDTGWPMALNILRICCVRPSRSFTSNQLLPSSSVLPVVFTRAMSHGSVRLPSMVMPRCSLSISRCSGTPRTFT